MRALWRKALIGRKTGGAPFGPTNPAPGGYSQYATAPQYNFVKPTTWEGGINQGSTGVDGGTRTISGRNFQGADGAYATADFFNVSDTLIIENCNFTGAAQALLRISNINSGSKVIVRNCRFWGARQPGMGPGHAIAINGNIGGTIELLNNFVIDSNGILWQDIFNSPGVHKVIGNDLRNINHISTDGTSDGWSGGLQFVHCRPINVEVAYNSIWGEPGKVDMQDACNFFACQGTSTTWIKVHHNIVFGHYPYPLNDTAATSGSSFTTDGDYNQASDPTKDPCFIELSNNYAARHTFGCMNIAGGHDIRMINNRMVSTGKQPSGTPLAGSPMGGYSGGIGCYDYMNRGASGFYNLDVSGNILGEVNPQGNRADNTSSVAQTSLQTLLPDPITEALETEQWQRWVADCVAAGVQNSAVLTASGNMP